MAPQNRTPKGSANGGDSIRNSPGAGGAATSGPPEGHRKLSHFEDSKPGTVRMPKGTADGGDRYAPNSTNGTQASLSGSAPSGNVARHPKGSATGGDPIRNSPGAGPDISDGPPEGYRELSTLEDNKPGTVRMPKGTADGGNRYAPRGSTGEPNRVQKGVKSGGEFAKTLRGEEPGVTLTIPGGGHSAPAAAPVAAPVAPKGNRLSRLFGRK